MNKFRQWMEDRGHGGLFMPKKQMLIGFMIEYIREKRGGFVGIGQHAGLGCRRPGLFTIEEYYGQLEEYIEVIGRGES